MKEKYRISFWVPDTLWGKLFIPFYKIMRNRQAIKEIGLYEIISKEWKYCTLDYQGRIGYCLTIWIDNHKSEEENKKSAGCRIGN